MTESVFVVQYTHKHGDGVNIYSTIKKAESAAANLMDDRIAESWDDSDRAAYDRCKTFEAKLKYFHTVERDVSYGERINVFECVVE